MNTEKDIFSFLSVYDEKVNEFAVILRHTILKNLPGIIEQLDMPARIIAYSYGNRYIDMICTIIPSKKGLKLGFYKGDELYDPENLLEGNGKISRYVIIHSAQQIKSAAIQNLLLEAWKAYKQRMGLN